MVKYIILSFKMDSKKRLNQIGDSKKTNNKFYMEQKSHFYQQQKFLKI